jgi:hypothetical protein
MDGEHRLEHRAEAGGTARDVTFTANEDIAEIAP